MKNYKYFFAPILAAICWSSAYITINLAFESFRPITIVLLRVIVASIFMLAIGFSLKKLDKIKKSHIKWFIILGLIEPFSYFLCEVYGLTMVSATLAAVILSTIPLFSPIFSSIFLKEKVTVANIVGIVISILGVGLIILDGKGDFSYQALGVLLIFGALIVAIIYALYVKRLAEHYSEITIVTAQNIIGIFLFLPLFFIIDFKHLGELAISISSILAILVLGVFASALAFIFYAYSLKNIGIVRTNAFLNLLPAMTAVLAFFILGDKLSHQMVLGIAVVIGGLYVSQVKFKKKE
jgi:drug/metabolite transporter (DMT)-like permease